MYHWNLWSVTKIDLILILVGFLVGILSGSVGIGGGFILVPFLYYYKFDDMHMAVGTALAAMIGVAISGAIRHTQYDNVNWPVAITLMVGLAVGALVGAWVNENISSTYLARILGIIMLVAGIKLIIKP